MKPKKETSKPTPKPRAPRSDLESPQARPAFVPRPKGAATVNVKGHR